MDQDRTYDRVAENHFQALLRSGRDPLDARGTWRMRLRSLLPRASWNLRRLFGRSASNTARQKLSQKRQGRADGTRHLTHLEVCQHSILTGAG